LLPQGCLDLLAEKMAVHDAKMLKDATNECETILRIFDIF